MASSILGFRLNCLPLKSKDGSLVILGKTKKAKRACSFACGDFVIRRKYKHGVVSLASSSSSSSFSTRGYKNSRKKKEGCMSLASLGISPEKSNNVSGALPFVVAGTAALALINPASYAWVSKEYYAPALGGIMLSIGIQLSIEDFALAFQRQEEDVCKTISLCSGMQSSTLAGMLATQFLGSTQAVPAACSVVAMAIMGLSLASFWGRGLRILELPLLILQPSHQSLTTKQMES